MANFTPINLTGGVPSSFRPSVPSSFSQATPPPVAPSVPSGATTGTPEQPVAPTAPTAPTAPLASGNPLTSFNSALMGMLNQYKGLSTADLLKQKNAILKAMYKKGAEMTPEELRTLSPEQQQAIRTGQGKALEPELSAVTGEITEREAGKADWLTMFNTAKDMGNDIIALQDKQRERAFDTLGVMATAGQDLSEQYLSDLSSLTGLDTGTLTGYYDELKRKSDYDREIDDLTKQIKQKQLNDEKGTIVEQIRDAVTQGTARDVLEIKLKDKLGDPLPQSVIDLLDELYSPDSEVSGNGSGSGILNELRGGEGSTLYKMKEFFGLNPKQDFSQVGNDTKKVAEWTQKYPTGKKGGQCGTFAHNLAEFPPVGNWLSEKKKAVDRSGISRSEWVNRGVKVGDVIVTDENRKHGHLAVVNKVLPNGVVQLTDSNYNLDEKVNHNRKMSIYSNRIYGAFI